MSKIGRGTQYDGFLNAIIQIMCDLMFLSLKKFGKQEERCKNNISVNSVLIFFYLLIVIYLRFVFGDLEFICNLVLVFCDF